jgi:RHS repeat-associated protein
LLSEQIADAANGNRTTSYTYDAVGNRLTIADSVAGTTSYTYNNNDWLVTQTHSGEQTLYTYDNNGSLLSKFHNANDKVAYTWNLDRRLAGVQTTDTSGTHQSTYTYDADGNRVRQNVDGVSTNYLVDTNRRLAQVAAEYDSSGVKASYTYAGGVISQSSNNVRTFYVNDGHSGVRLITNNTGAVTDAYNYDGYGNLLQSVGNASNERYRCESSDSSTGLQYLRARYYDPSTGRFLSTDAFEGTLKNPVSRHRYLYGNNNPLTYSDPSGNFATSIGEVSSILAILETLFITASVQASVGIIADKISGSIAWTGTLYAAELDPSILGIGFGGGLDLLDLTTDTEEKSPFLWPGLKTKFRGKWLQVLAGVQLNPSEAVGGPIQSPLNGSIAQVIATSPRIIQATPVAFAGASVFAGGTDGVASTSVFSAGFGKGVITDSSSPLPDAGASLSIKEGISIPVYLFPYNQPPSLFGN